ncbi:MAG: flagellar biosynthesis protein FlhA [Planctomycetota bacterium]
MTSQFVKRWPDFLLPVGIIACLMVIFVPLPPALMDILLAANISAAVVILLATVYVRSPLELSVFPSLLLMTTLARLALNVGTTRLILTRGATEGELAAGSVIQSFAQFVTGDSLVVGLVIFSIIVVIQFVVITKGATRISEVAARFTLDGLPGRQMAIDADLSAGVIDNDEAQRRREETIAHAEFYGTMDGASKFVRGDAVAAVVITLINILGGLIVGLSHSMSLGDAAATFTRLTIGDGLASQLPALLISLAAGLLVTRSTRKTDLPRESMNQVFARPMVLVITAVFLGMMVLTELPKIPLLIIACACLGGAYLLFHRNDKSEPETPATAPTPPPKPDQGIEHLLSDEFVEMQLGLGLIRLANSRLNGTLMARVGEVRQSVANKMGVVVPKVTVRDNMKLEPNQFKILIQGRVVEQGRVEPDFCLAIDAGRATQPLADGVVKGLADDHLAEGPAFWINAEAIQSAAEAGYEVRTSTDVLILQLESCSIEYADQLITRDATRQLLESVKKRSPTVVEEVCPRLLSLSQVQRVLKQLVREGISIRPLTLILESLGDSASEQMPVWRMVEQVRIRLAHHIAAGLTGDHGGSISVVTVSDELQQRVACAWDPDRDDLRLDLSRVVVDSLTHAIDDAADQMVIAGLPPIAMVNQEIRPVVAELVKHNKTPIFVLGSDEARPADIFIVGEIKSENIQTVADAA